MKILFTGGGTGGHIYPIISIIEELRERKALSFKCIYVGSGSFPEQKLKELFVSSKKILAGKIRRYFSFQNILDIAKTFVGIIQAYWILLVEMPDLIFGKGGYASFPIVFVGWLFRIPIIIHESDAVPGLANRILGRFAMRIAYSFKFEKDYFSYEKLVFTGNPIRASLLNGKKEEAELCFHFKKNKKTILVIGGSQGAQILNNVILDILGAFIERYEVIHQCGSKHFEGILREARVAAKKEDLASYHLFPFLCSKELALAYAAADLVVSRAGAGSIFEIAALGKPSILVPLANSSYGHQRENAHLYHEAGACKVIEEENLKPHLFLETINNLINNESLLKQMKKSAKNFAKPEAAKLIADEILKLANSRINNKSVA